MEKTRESNDLARRTDAARRARRGLVAGYIHTLSARHATERPLVPSALPARAKVA